MIGGEVSDGEVHLMSNARDHRQGALYDGTRQGLIVKGPEILERTTAARQNDGVEVPLRFAVSVVQSGVRIDILLSGLLRNLGLDALKVLQIEMIRELQRVPELPGRTFTLNHRADNRHAYGRISTFQHLQDVLQRGTRGRSDHSQVRNISGQLAFAVGAEQALLLELIAQGVELGLKGSRTRRFHEFTDKLEVASSLVERNSGSQANLIAVLR